MTNYIGRIVRAASLTVQPVNTVAICICIYIFSGRYLSPRHLYRVQFLFQQRTFQKVPRSPTVARTYLEEHESKVPPRCPSRRLSVDIACVLVGRTYLQVFTGSIEYRCADALPPLETETRGNHVAQHLLSAALCGIVADDEQSCNEIFVTTSGYWGASWR